jgi:hypothetical protein
MMRGTWQTTSGGSGGLVLVLIAVAVLAGSGALTAIMHAAEVMVIVVLGGVFVAAVLTGTVAVMLARATARNAARVGAELAQRRQTLSDRPTRPITARPVYQLPPEPAPRLSEPSKPAIEHHEHNHYGPEFHIYGADGQDAAARLIRKALTEGHQP